MGQKSGPVKEPAERVVREVRRASAGRFCVLTIDATSAGIKYPTGHGANAMSPI
jgi:hypothetical protein